MNEIESLMTMNNEFIYVGMHVDALGKHKVSEIVEREENGHMAKIPIYQVYVKDGNNMPYSGMLWKKVPSQMCSVTYKMGIQ